MIIELCTAAFLGGLTVKMLPKGWGQRRLAIRRLHFAPGEIVYDVAFEGEWELAGDNVRQLSRAIVNGVEHLHIQDKLFISNGYTRCASEIIKEIEPLNRAYHKMMAKRPDDYDADRDPPEVKEFFQQVRRVMMFSPGS